MGLDNFPRRYPCLKHGSAVMSAKDPNERIDCEATIEAGGCPWREHLGDEPGAVRGIFGAPCWWRGKYSTWMLDLLEQRGASPLAPKQDEVPDRRIDFYGHPSPNEDEGNILTPEEAVFLADFMADNGELFADALEHLDGYRESAELRKHEIEAYLYVIKWLRFCAAEGDGIGAWY